MSLNHNRHHKGSVRVGPGFFKTFLFLDSCILQGTKLAKEKFTYLQKVHYVLEPFLWVDIPSGENLKLSASSDADFKMAFLLSSYLISQQAPDTSSVSSALAAGWRTPGYPQCGA